MYKNPYLDRVWVIILAAGYSTRMGKPKGLLPIKGDVMLRRIVKKIGTESPVAVILRKNQIGESEALKDLAVSVFHPDQDPIELSDSLREAIRFARYVEASAVVILLGDQPDIEPVVVNRLIQHHAKTHSPIVQARYLDGPGHPVLFDKSMFVELLKIKGDQGARQLLKRQASKISQIAVHSKRLVDLDTPGDYERFLSKNR